MIERAVWSVVAVVFAVIATLALLVAVASVFSFSGENHLLAIRNHLAIISSVFITYTAMRASIGCLYGASKKSEPLP